MKRSTIHKPETKLGNMSSPSTLTFLEHYCLKTWPELFLAFLCFLSIWCLKQRKKVMTEWPVIGILPSLIANAHRIHDWTTEIANTFGATVARRAGPACMAIDFLFTCDPCNIEYIARTNFLNFPKGTEFNGTFDILGEGIFNVDDELWHKQRSMARVAMASNTFRRSVSIAASKVLGDSLLPVLASKESPSVIDLEDVLLRYTFDTSMLFIFGRNPKCLSADFPENEFQKAMENGLESVFYRHILPHPVWKLFKWLNIWKERQLKQAWKTIDQYVEQYISEKKRLDLIKGSTQAENNDILETYINFQKQESWPDHMVPKNDKFLRDAMLSLLFAGRDTVGAGLSWFFWSVCKDPRVVSKVVDELRLVYSKKQRDHSIVNEKQQQQQQQQQPWLLFDAVDLREMVYLHAALCESMRLYPPLPLNRKTPLKEDVLPDGTVARPGTMVVISTFAMGRMEWIWGKDWAEFKPERWIDAKGMLSREMQSFFTFNIGPRACLGKNVAFTLMKMAASAVLLNFHVELLAGQKVEPKSTLVLRMKNGLKVRVERRNNT
ncbi:hypothetical protein Sjap_018744 [Stephania japonica]|uniref:Cytochrome P450 n=1 Tax=Stephania japonica TaxID=461633 RepID=A0AAP0I8L2_9MAGN